MSDTPIKDRAKRIHKIREARRSGIWNNHPTASYQFQLLDAVRDCRLMLVLIFIVLMIKL